MPTLVGAFGVVAALSVLAVLLLIFGSKIPEPLRDVDGGSTIGFVFVVYFAAIGALVLGAIGRSQLREVFSSRYKYIFAASALVIIVFVGLVSFALYGLLQATDL